MPEFFDSTSRDPWKTKQSLYARGGRVRAKEGDWIQKGQVYACLFLFIEEGVCTHKP